MRWYSLLLLPIACATQPEPKPAPSTVYLPPAEAHESAGVPPERASSQPKDYRHRPPGSAEDRLRAQQLFDEGKQLIAKGDYPAGCSKMEQSLDADPALGTLMNLADCRRREGNIPAACSLFTEAQKWARDTGSVDRERFITETLKSLNC
jgi:hypothetical protein